MKMGGQFQIIAENERILAEREGNGISEKVETQPVSLW